MRVEELRKITLDGIDNRRKEKMKEGMERIHSGIYDGVFERMKERGSIGEWFIKIPIGELPAEWEEFENDMKLLGYEVESMEREYTFILKWK
jgi:hypothetical protein